MKDRNKLLISTIIIISLLVGIILGCIISNWDFLKNTFFDFKLSEIIQWIISIFIVILLAYFVNDRINNNFRKKELVLELISSFQQKTVDIFTLGNDYINNPDPNKQNKIVYHFKTASSLLNLILNIKNDDLIKETTSELEGLKWEFFNFKKALTDTPFGSRNITYTPQDVMTFQKTYDSLINTLFHCKINIYS